MPKSHKPRILTICLGIWLHPPQSLTILVRPGGPDCVNKHKLIGSILIAVLAMPYPSCPCRLASSCSSPAAEILKKWKPATSRRSAWSIHELPGASVSDELLIQGRYFDVEDHWQKAIRSCSGGILTNGKPPSGSSWTRQTFKISRPTCPLGLCLRPAEFFNDSIVHF